MLKRISLFALFQFIAIVAFSQEKTITVLFEYNKYDIPDTSLVHLVKFIASSPIERVLLEGHCDSIGSKKYNDVLSRNRANEVQKLLIQNGLPKRVIKTCIGYGKEKPIAENNSEAFRQLNRRVHVTFYMVEKEERQLKLDATDKPILLTTVVKKSELKQNKKILLENMHFFGGRHILKPSSMPELESLLQLLLENPSLEIEIQGHVCCTTTEADGYDWDNGTHNLSVTRAKMIHDYLIEKGIKAHRLEYRGFGGTQKLNSDESIEELKAKNRRVEIKILHE